MAQYTKDGITLDKNGGSGNTTVTVTSTVNEGLDTAVTFRVSVDEDVYSDITVNREGRREIFTNNDFVLSDGTTFNVIKEGYV